MLARLLRYSSPMRRLAPLSLAACLGLPLAAQPARPLSPAETRARAIFEELVAIDTTDSSGNVTAAAEAVAKRLRAAGFPEADVVVDGPNARKKNLVARLHGTGERRPLLLLAHLDVVEAKRSDWSPDIDPFRLTERDGYFYGRGTSDIKDGAAILAATLIRLKESGFVPDRDLILALTADEEGGDSNGVAWLLKERRALVDASYCVNTDGGDFQLDGSKKRLVAIQASEKSYVSFVLETKDRGGHSSQPGSENAIARLAAALVRLSALTFPVRLNEVTRGYFGKMSSIEGGPYAADMKAAAREAPDAAALARLSESPYFNALLRTTCVPTLLSGGHAENALPQLARATVNCRLLPGEEADGVKKALEAAVADPGVSVALVRPVRAPNPPSRLEPELVSAVERSVAAMWPGLPVVPVMETGGTDGATLRPAGIPTFGVSGVFIDYQDSRAHGKDERIPVASFYEGLAFYERLVKELSRGR